MSLGGEVTGTVPVGRFVLEVGSQAGTRVFFSPGQMGGSTELRVALSQPPAPPAETALAGAEDVLEDMGSVVGRIERALELFTALAQGKVLDKKVLLKEVDALIGALERLDRRGHHRDALRLARALASLLALATLRIREEIGDEAGAEATRHNLAMLSQVFPDIDETGGGRGLKPLVVAAIIGGVILLAAGGVAIGIAIVGDDDGPPAVDTTPLEVEITEFPDDPTEERSASFVFAANEEVRTFECRLDNGSFEECVSPTNIPGPLVVGPHAFAVRATDFAGNTGAAVSYEWTIELGVGPSVTIRDGPKELTNETTARFSLDAPGAIRLECKVDDEDVEECPTMPSFEVGEGDHTFVARAFDANDNAGPEATYQWTVDTTGPTVRIDDVSFPDGASVRIFFNPSESGSVVECVLLEQTDSDPVELQTVDGCTSPVVLPARTGGAYLVRITATDPAGNVGETTEEEIDRTVD